MSQLFGDLAENRLLRRSQFQHQRHEQTLAFDALGGALAQDFFEQHALMGNVLVDNPQTVFVDREDKRIANLAQRPQRSQRLQRRWSVRFLLDRRRASVVGNGDLRGARQRYGSVRLDGNSSFKLQMRRRWRNGLRLQRKAADHWFSKVTPGSICAVAAPSARSERLAGPGLRVNLR